MAEENNGIANGTNATGNTADASAAPATGSTGDGGIGYMISLDDLGLTFECIGLALRHVWTQPQSDLNFVFRATALMERITPAVQAVAASRQGGAPLVPPQQ